jgi:hypothetical protein
VSDCGVCVYSGYDGDGGELISDTIRVARKTHHCCECGRAILRGERYGYACGKSDGSFWANKTCLICDEIRTAFCCDGWIYGNLWDGMREVMGGLTVSCFERLSTPEAKTELRLRWMQWKGLAR